MNPTINNCSKCNKTKQYVKNIEFIKQEEFINDIINNPTCNMTILLDYINNQKIEEYIKQCINCDSKNN